ncbi:hypothetical protein Bca4012_083718 [Brassica carinata]
METIMRSQFGRLFELPVALCHNYAKLIHSFLCRQLLTVRKYELWFQFATHPLRFSLDEFQQVTGLNCGAFHAADSEEEDAPGSTMWHQLFDTAIGDITVTDVLWMLRNPFLATWKRVPLVLIALVDGVICCSNKWLKLTPKYVEMLCDQQYFLEYPWGRESLLKTLPRFLPPYESNDPLGEMRHRLSQQTIAAYGFLLALQLFSFEAIPLLLEKIPDAKFTDNFLVDPLACEKAVTILYVNDIVQVEEDPAWTSISNIRFTRWRHFICTHSRGKKNADKPTGQPVCQRKLRKGVRKVEKPNAQPVHQRNLRPRKPATVIIEDISSSEASEPQGPPQPKQVAELSRIFFCSRCGLSEATTQQTRKKKANNDDHGLSGSPKSVDPQNEQANLKAKRTKTAVSTPPLRKHSYSLRSGDSLWSGDGMDVSDEVNKGTTSTYADIDRGDVDDDANESTVNQQRPTPADLLPESFNDEKPVNVTWGESNPHLYTSWIRATVLQHQSPVRIVKFRLHPPQVKKFGGSEFRRCGEKVRVPSTAVEAVEHSSSSPDLDIGGCGGPMVDDPNTTILVPGMSPVPTGNPNSC